MESKPYEENLLYQHDCWLLLLDKFQRKQMLSNLVQQHDYCIFVVSKMEIHKGEGLFLTLMVVLVTFFLSLNSIN